MSYGGGDITLGGLSTFNMQHGFVEALVRGYRSGFLTDTDYHHLTQCDNLEVNLLFTLILHSKQLYYLIYYPSLLLSVLLLHSLLHSFFFFLLSLSLDLLLK